MSNLFILTKNSFNMLVGRFLGKKKRSSTTSASVIFVTFVVGIIALYSYQAWIMFDGLGAMGFGKLCMFHACTTTISVLAILSIMRAAATEKTSDNDLLLSLPLKKHEIIISKLINKYIFDFFFLAMLFLPYLIIYQIRCEFSTQILIMGLILTFVLPLFSIGVSHVLDYVFSRIFNKSRMAKFLKSLTTTIIFVIVMCLLLVITSTYGTTFNSPNLEDYFAQRPITNLLLKFMFTPSFTTVLLVLVISLVPFGLGFTLYISTLGKPIITYKSKLKTLKFTDRQNPFKILLKKEFYNYATTPAYLINTIIGVVLIFAIGIFIAITGIDGLSSMFGIVQIPTSLLAGIIALIFCFASATTFITAPSISLEGKSFWFIKSQPVSASAVLWSKALLHIILIDPVIILTSTVIAISLKLTFLEYLIILILPLIHSLIMCFSGLLFNLWLPNFNWENETMVVKQSAPSLLSMMFGFLLTAGIIGLFMAFKHLDFALIFAIISGIYLAALAITILLTFTLGQRLFKRL